MQLAPLKPQLSRENPIFGICCTETHCEQYIGGFIQTMKTCWYYFLTTTSKSNACRTHAHFSIPQMAQNAFLSKNGSNASKLMKTVYEWVSTNYIFIQYLKICVVRIQKSHFLVQKWPNMLYLVKTW